MAFVPHPRCETPPDDAEVWRFMSLAKFLDLVERSALWFTRVDLLDDQAEGGFTESERQFLQTEPHGKSLLSMFEANRQLSYVSSWYEGIDESMAMWDLYGNVAIHSTIGQLKDSLKNVERDIFIGRVEYLDWVKAQSWPNNAIGMLVRKSRSYIHERELRLLIWAHDLMNVELPSIPGQLPLPNRSVEAKALAEVFARLFRDKPPFTPFTESEWVAACHRAIDSWLDDYRLQKRPLGLRIEIAPLTALQEIVVGPREPAWTVEVISKAVGRYGLRIPVRQSSLVERLARRQSSGG